MEYYPVINQQSEFNKGVTEYFISNGEPKEASDFFKYEREMYPDNINVFALKWINKIINQVDTKEIIQSEIKSDLQEIDQINTELSNKSVIYFIGYYLMGDTTNYEKELLNIVNYKNIPILNNYFIADFFHSILAMNKTPEEIGQDSTFVNILINNPESRLSETIFNSGQIFDYYPPNSNKATIVINLIDNKLSKNIPLNISEQLAYILYSSFSADTRQREKAISITNDLLSLLYQEKDFCERNASPTTIDPLNHFSLKKSSLYNFATLLFFNTDSIEKGLKLQNYIISRTKPDDDDYLESVLYKARFFQKAQMYDSMLVWYAKSYKLSSSKRNLKRIKKYLSEIINLEDEEYIQLFDTIIRTNQIPESFHIYNGLDITTPDSGKVNLKSGKYLLEFYSNNCTFCKANLKSLNKYSDDFFRNNNLKVLIVTNIEKSQYTKEFSTYNFPYEVVANSREIISFFNVQLFPVTIYIDNNVVKKRIDGGNKNGIALEEILK